MYSFLNINNVRCASNRDQITQAFKESVYYTCLHSVRSRGQHVQWNSSVSHLGGGKANAGKSFLTKLAVSFLKSPARFSCDGR